MNYLLALACASVIAISTIGCGTEEGCARPLSDFFCVSRDICPTFEEAVAEGYRDADTGEVEVTPCEGTRFIVWFRNIDGGGSVLYFDESDAIVAAESFGYEYELCGGQVLFGPVPECPDEQWWRGVYCISCRDGATLGPPGVRKIELEPRSGCGLGGEGAFGPGLAWRSGIGTAPST